MMVLFERNFLVGRTLSGKESTNFLLISDLQFLKLSQSNLTHIVIHSGLDFVYDFIDQPNDQYLNPAEGTKLFRIMCERLVAIKKIFLGIDDGTNQDTDGFQKLN